MYVFYVKIRDKQINHHVNISCGFLTLAVHSKEKHTDCGRLSPEIDTCNPVIVLEKQTP
jgi:hypothetical protein